LPRLADQDTNADGSAELDRDLVGVHGAHGNKANVSPVYLRKVTLIPFSLDGARGDGG
jgi:hypothetical protein